MPCIEVILKLFGCNRLQGNLSTTNLKEPKIMFFIAEILLLLGLFTIELTTEGVEVKIFIAGIL
jgi:hypothetical protein